MGLSASQARLLTITSRLSDLELRAQNVSNTKIRLSQDSGDVSKAYSQALDKETYQMLTGYNNSGSATYSDVTYNTLMNPNTAALSSQYCLTNQSGQVLVSKAEASKYGNPPVTLNEFLIANGAAGNTNIIPGTTTYPTAFPTKALYDAEKARLDGIVSSKAATLQPYLDDTSKQVIVQTDADAMAAKNAAEVAWHGADGKGGALKLYTDALANATPPAGAPAHTAAEDIATLLGTDGIGEANFAANSSSMLTDTVYTTMKAAVEDLQANLAASMTNATTETQKDKIAVMQCDLTVVALALENAHTGTALTNTSLSAESASMAAIAAIKVILTGCSLDSVLPSSNADAYNNAKGEFFVSRKNGKGVNPQIGWCRDSNGKPTTQIQAYYWKDAGSNYAGNLSTLYTDLITQSPNALSGEGTGGIAPAGAPTPEAIQRLKTEAERLEGIYNGLPSTGGSNPNPAYTKALSEYNTAVYNRNALPAPVTTGGSSTITPSTNTDYYTKLYERMGGGTSIKYFTVSGDEDSKINNSDWISAQLQNGGLNLEKVVNGAWEPTSASGDSTNFTTKDDDAAIAKAEAKYNSDMDEIETKDKRLDLELKNIDTEHSALQTEKESVTTIINKNIERSFKIFDA